MKNQEFKKYFYYGITAVSVIAICIVFWYSIRNWSSLKTFFHSIFGIVAPIVYGAVLAYLVSPVYNRTKRWTVSKLSIKWKSQRYVDAAAKALGTIVCLLLVILIVAGLFRMLLPQMLESIVGIRDSLPIYLQNLYVWIQQMLSDNPDIEAFVLNNLQSGVKFAENWMESSFLNMDFTKLGNLLTGFSSSIINLLIFIKNWLIGLIVMVYLLNIKDVLIAQSKKIVYGCLNIRFANAVVNEMRFVHKMFGGFIIGKLLDSLIIGIICFAGTTWMKMPFPLLISVIVGVTNIIPFFGPFIGAIPSGFLVLLVSPVKCLYFLLFVLLLQQFDGNILGPKILGDYTGLSSFWVLFSILLFGGLFGFVGMIIAVPAFAVIYDLIAKGVNRSLAIKKLSQNTEDYKELKQIDETDKTFIK